MIPEKTNALQLIARPGFPISDRINKPRRFCQRQKKRRKRKKQITNAIAFRPKKHESERQTAVTQISQLSRDVATQPFNTLLQPIKFERSCHVTQIDQLE